MDTASKPKNQNQPFDDSTTETKRTERTKSETQYPTASTPPPSTVVNLTFMLTVMTRRNRRKWSVNNGLKASPRPVAHRRGCTQRSINVNKRSPGIDRTRTGRRYYAGYKKKTKSVHHVWRRALCGQTRYPRKGHWRWTAVNVGDIGGWR